MEVIYGGRQTGKTTKLIELAAKSETKGEVCYIVVSSQQEAFRIANLAKELGKNIGFPITYSEFLGGEYHGQHIKRFYIDNAEFLLQRLTRVPIAAITINKADDFGG